MGVFLLGSLGKCNLLGDTKAAVIADLGVFVRPPRSDDPKQWKLLEAVILALAKIDDPDAVPYLASVLLSPEERFGSELQWITAEALGRLVREPFGDAEDPIEAAKSWLLSR